MQFAAKKWYGKLVEGAILLAVLLVVAKGVDMLGDAIGFIGSIFGFGFLGWTVGGAIGLTIAIALVARFFKPKKM